MNTCTLRVLGALVAIAVALATSANASAPTGRYVVTNGGTASGTCTHQDRAHLATGNPVDHVYLADAKTYCAGVGASLGARLAPADVQRATDHRR